MPGKSEMFDLEKLPPFQKKMLRASKKEVTLPDFLRDFVALKKLYAAFNGDSIAAMSKTLYVFICSYLYAQILIPT